MAPIIKSTDSAKGLQSYKLNYDFIFSLVSLAGLCLAKGLIGVRGNRETSVKGKGTVPISVLA